MDWNNIGIQLITASNESGWAKWILPPPSNIQTVASPFAEQNGKTYIVKRLLLNKSFIILMNEQMFLSVAKELKTYPEDIYEDEPKLVPPAQEFPNHKPTPDIWSRTAEISHDTGSINPKGNAQVVRDIFNIGRVFITKTSLINSTWSII